MKDTTIQDTTVQEAKKETKRILAKWFMILFAYHILSAAFYNIILKRMVTELARDKYFTRAYITVLIFGIGALIALCIWHSLTEARYTEYRDSLKKALAEENFSLLGYLFGKFGRINILRAVLYVAFQIPFMIFFHFFGFDAQYSTVFEKFYIIEAGFYQTIGNCILGTLISALCLLLCLFVSQLAFLVANYRYVLENSSTLSQKSKFN